MKLTYLPVRGRAEPILLLLVDSGIDFEQEIVTPEEWRELKSKGENGPPHFPFAALPVLTFSHGARGGNDSRLAETSAILLFLEGKLAAAGTTTSPPDAKARLEMIRCASAFLLSRLFFSVTPDWLAPPSREHILKSFVIPYLSSLSFHLSSSFFPPLLTPPLQEGRPGTSLSPAAATAYTAISLIQQIFPHSLGPGQDGGMMQHFPKCEHLRMSVEDRPRIKAWIESGKRAEEWTVREGGEIKKMRELADKYDRRTEEILDGQLVGEKVGLQVAKEEMETETGE